MPHTARRASIALTVAVLLSACGSGDSGTESAATEGAPSGGAETTAPSGDSSQFCSEAGRLEDRVDSALADADGGDPSVADALRQVTEELRGIEPPESIRSDWTAMANGLDRMSDVFADFDITDSESLAALDSAEEELSTASTNVENYLRDVCGIEP